MPKASSAFLWMAALLLFLLAAAPVQVVNAQNCGTSRRRPWRSLSCSDQDEYLDAYRQLKASGRWNELVRVHQQSGDWGHEVPMFLLWHRYVTIIILRQKKEKYFWLSPLGTNNIMGVFTPDISFFFAAQITDGTCGSLNENCNVSVAPA